MLSNVLTYLSDLIAAQERNYVLARNIRRACLQHTRQRRRGDPTDAVVVAVLGAAHLNGVRKILLETRTV